MPKKIIDVVENWLDSDSSTEYENQAVEIEYALADAGNIQSYKNLSEGDTLVAIRIEYVNGERAIIDSSSTIEIDHGGVVIIK